MIPVLIVKRNSLFYSLEEELSEINLSEVSLFGIEKELLIKVYLYSIDEELNEVYLYNIDEELNEVYLYSKRSAQWSLPL